MEFQKNHLWKTTPTKIIGPKVLKQSNHFEITKQFLSKNLVGKMDEKPMTPERRLEEQKNQRHFMYENNRFPK